MMFVVELKKKDLKAIKKCLRNSSLRGITERDIKEEDVIEDLFYVDGGFDGGIVDLRHKVKIKKL